MKRVLAFMFAAVLVAAAICSVSLHAQRATHHYLILARGHGPGSTSFLTSVRAAGGTVTAVYEDIGIVLADSSNPAFSSRVESMAAVQGVAEDVSVQWISPNERAVRAGELRVRPTGVNTEPLNGDLWNLRQIHADATAAAGYQGEGAVVAVIDTGINTGHPDLAPNIDFARSYAFVPSTLGAGYPPYEDDYFHGSHVAGIIAGAINDVGIQGVAPRAKIVAIKVMDSEGSGSFGNIIGGILYATSLHVDVINMSLAATFDRVNAGGGGIGTLLAALNRAINFATAERVFVVSSAGNDGVNLNSRAFSIPAQSGNGMAVAATGPIARENFDRPASYTNYGQSVIDVAAPGGDLTLFPSESPFPWYLDMVLSCGNRGSEDPDNADTYFYAAGTSMAAPHVSGLAALIVGQYGHLGAAQIGSIIGHSADDILAPGADPYSGRGRINAARALGLQ